MPASDHDEDAWSLGDTNAYLDGPSPTVGDVDVGQRIAEFVVVSHLGRGGMGVVYRARDVNTGREVALKVIRGARADDRSLERFRREGQLTAALSDAGVVAIHAAGVHEGCPYLAYELVEGAQTLDDAWAELDLAQRVAMVRDAARAVGAAHARGIVHRDLKPENVLVDAHGRVRVVDFGLAALVGLERLTATGVVVGTPLYLSPEQALGQDPTPLMDTWALGVILYKAICDAMPFMGASFFELVTLVVNSSYPDPRERVPDLPEAYVAILARALASNGAERYANGLELADDLDRALAGEAPRAQIEGAHRRALRIPWPGIAVGAVVLGVVGFAIGYRPAPGTPQPTRPLTDRAEPPPRDPEPTPTKKPSPKPEPTLAELVPAIEGPLRKLREEALAGDDLALTRLGTAFRRGRGVSEDQTVARLLYEAATERGNLAAMVHLSGMAFDEGKPDEGVELLERAGEAGNLSAWVDLGRLLRSGQRGVERDLPRARACFRRAADGNYTDGLTELGNVLLNGEGGPADPLTGISLLRRAVDAGDMTAVTRLGSLLYFGGAGITIDRPEGLGLLRKAYERRKPHAALDYGRALLLEGERASGLEALRFAANTRPEARERLREALVADPASAVELREGLDLLRARPDAPLLTKILDHPRADDDLRSGAELALLRLGQAGSDDALLAVARARLERNSLLPERLRRPLDPSDRARAEQLWSRAAQRRERAGMYGYGLLLWSRDAANRREALLWLRRAMNAGEARSTLFLAHAQREGRVQGKPRLVRALELYEKSARQGSEEGRAWVGLILRRGLGGIEKDFERARRELEAAARAGNGLARLELANMHLNTEGGLDDLEAARELLEGQVEPLKLWLTLGDARIVRAIQLAKRDKAAARPLFEGAIADYTRVLELDASSWHALGNRGGAYAQLDMKAEATQDMRASLKLNATQPNAQFLRDWLRNEGAE